MLRYSHKRNWRLSNGTMKKGSVYCSMGFVLLFGLALLGLLFFAPRIMAVYTQWRLISAAVSAIVLAAFYCSALPAAVSLVCLFLLLRNILGERPFLRRNCLLIGIVSWCCVAVAAITLVGGFWYMPLLLVTAAMVFIFLILRVVRRCFDAAIALKEENSLTI